jgi:hypothetical protein
MLCPNCGTTTTTEQKFCRSCGMNLEPVARALTAHLAHGGAAAAAARATEQSAARRMTSALAASILVALFGLLMMAFMPNPTFKMFGFAAALIGIVAALAAVFSTLRATGDAREGPAQHALDGAQAAKTGRLLHETTLEPAPSVTEHTTELLSVERDGPEQRRD